MAQYLEELANWFRDYNESQGRRRVSVEFREGPADRAKRAAWIIGTGARAEGQLTLWGSGECETEAVGDDGMRILARSRVVADPAQVAAVADDLVDHVADYSGT